MKVFDEDGTLLGLLTADLLVGKRLICEIKGCSALLEAHTAQFLGLPAYSTNRARSAN